ARIGEIGRHPVEAVRAFFFKHRDRVIFGTDRVIGWHGSAGEESSPERIAAIGSSYEAHWRFFETEERQIEYPGFPIQGRWKVDAIGLPDEVLDKLYRRNVQRLVPQLQRLS
ncbi:MAG: hypothetical protein JSV36_05865, partial [Anaerolineae bacterium]